MSFVSPIQHKIPASNNYKNVNITNFKGTSYSDNLFDGNSSGCSESENVYINEENILAVRPRLKHVANFENIREIKQVNIIDENTMIYYVETLDGFKIIFSDKVNAGKQDNDIVIDLDEDLGKCSFFKDRNGKIICVSETGLYEVSKDDRDIKPINANHPDVVIPTVKQKMEFGDETSGEETLEKPNILSDKQYQLYRYNLNFLDPIPEDYVENRTFDTSDVVKVDYEDISTELLYTENAENKIKWIDKDLAFVVGPSWYVDRQRLTVRLTSVYENDGGITNNYLEFWDNRFSTSEYGEILDKNEQTIENVKGISFEASPKNTIVDGDTIYHVTGVEIYTDPESPDYGFEITIGKRERHEISRSKFYVKLQPIENVEFLTELFTGPSATWINENVKVDISIKIRNGELYTTLLIYKPDKGTYCVFNKEYVDVLSESYIAYYAPLVKISSNNVIPTLEDGIITNDNKLYYIVGEAPKGLPNPGYKRYLSYNILQIDTVNDYSKFLFEESLDTFEDYVASPRNNKSMGLKLVHISDDKFLIYPYTNEITSNDSELVYLNDIPKNESIETVLIEPLVPLATKLNKPHLAYSTIYKIPNTKSIISFKTENSKLIAYLHTNISQSNGSFKIGEWDDTIDYPVLYRWMIDESIRRYSVETIHDSVNATITYSLELETKITITPDTSVITIKEIVKNNEYQETLDFTNFKILDNKIWLYGSKEYKNKLIWSMNTSAFYFPTYNTADIGSDDAITNLFPLSNEVLGVFQKHNTTLLSEDENGNYIWEKTLRINKGCLGEDQVINIPMTNYPLVINDDSVALVMQSGNAVVEDSIFSIVSEDIFEKFATIKNKSEIKTHVHSYYVYLYWLNDDDESTDIWCLDCRTQSWFKWSLPIRAKFMYESDETIDQGTETETRIVTDDSEYVLTNENIHIVGTDNTEFNEDINAYVDELPLSEYRRIPWEWKSRIQTLGTTNYLKKIVSLQLIFSDKTRNEKFNGNNQLYFAVKTYRKKSNLLDGYFTTPLNAVGIQRIKVRLPKCDFAEIILSNKNKNTGQFDNITMVSTTNMSSDVSEDPMVYGSPSKINNKFDRLHLIGITLKILLSEGLNG